MHHDVNRMRFQIADGVRDENSQARLTSERMTRTMTAPMVALMMSRTALPPRLTPSCGNIQLATSAPMMPITMFPISPKPAPRTIRPASQPAIAPITSAAKIPIDNASLKSPVGSILVEKPRRSRRPGSSFDQNKQASPPPHGPDVQCRARTLSSMFLQFSTSLRDAQVPVSVREYLTQMEALNDVVAEQTVVNFYYLWH